MPQTRIFRDRVVSMEQTLEGGEKHLELLKSLCREALPEFEYSEHFLDHERDLFVMALGAPDGRRTKVCWTRMVLFDADRIPVLAGDPLSALRSKLLQYLRAHAGRPEIVVTFRHLEDGWVDTPGPRREKKRRRRGRFERRSGAPGQPARPSPPGTPGRPAIPRQPGPEPSPAAVGSGVGPPQAGAGRRRRRLRRRRRGGRSRGQSPAVPQP